MRRFASRVNVIVASVAGLSIAASACLLPWETGPVEVVTGDAAVDADLADVPGPRVDPDPPGTWNSFEDESKWEEHPLAGEFAGAAFDGQYVYFVPRGHLMLWRFNTMKAFGDGTAWESLEMPAPAVDGGPGGFVGAAIDRNRYVYFAPSGSNHFALRYSAAAPFTASSFQSFDLLAGLPGTFDPNRARDYFGVTPLGDFVYFIPYGKNRFIARFAQRDGFNMPASWERNDIPIDANFAGSIATPDAGLYLVPSSSNLSLFSGGKDLGNPESYATGPAISGAFAGGTSDGVNLYLVPAFAPNAFDFKIGDSLAAKKGVSGFDLSVYGKCTSACFEGAIFDGRHVYYVPSGASRFVRYDTKGFGFRDPKSWTYRDPIPGGFKQAGFFGGAFDGAYVYFVPSRAGKVVRYHSRPSPAMPPSYSGSFL